MYNLCSYKIRCDIGKLSLLDSLLMEVELFSIEPSGYWLPTVGVANLQSVGHRTYADLVADRLSTLGQHPACARESLVM
jgi:hypothetical protein